MTRKIVQRPHGQVTGFPEFSGLGDHAINAGDSLAVILTLISQKPITLLTDFGGKHFPMRPWQDSDVMTPWLGDGKQHVRVRWVTGVMW